MGFSAIPANLDQEIFSGARGIIKVNGEEVGQWTGMSFDETIENILFVQGGNPDPAAAVPVGRNWNFTLDYQQMVHTDPVGRKLLPGSSAEALLGWPVMEIDVLDAMTDDVICTFRGKPAGFSGSFGARTLMGINQRWVGLGLIWASEQSAAS